MPKFDFKLEGVLRQRKNAEQQLQRELAVFQGEMAELEAELRALDVSVQQTTEDLRQNRMTGRLDLNFLGAHRRFTLAMQRKAMGIAQLMNGVRIKMVESQRKLTEAIKKRKVLEKLREKQFEEWRQAMAKQELHDLDEVAMQMSYRQMLADEQAGAA
jgi:flagellar protein FliJ